MMKPHLNDLPNYTLFAGVALIAISFLLMFGSASINFIMWFVEPQPAHQGSLEFIKTQAPTLRGGHAGAWPLLSRSWCLIKRSKEAPRR